MLKVQFPGQETYTAFVGRVDRDMTHAEVAAWLDGVPDGTRIWGEDTAEKIRLYELLSSKRMFKKYRIIAEEGACVGAGQLVDFWLISRFIPPPVAKKPDRRKGGIYNYAAMEVNELRIGDHLALGAAAIYKSRHDGWNYTSHRKPDGTILICRTA